MTRRLAPAAVMGLVTVAAALVSTFIATTWPGALFIAVAGAPLTVLLLVRGTLRDVERSVVPSLLIGGVGVPILVVALNGIFGVVAAVLAAPVFEGLRTLSEEIRIDGDLVDLFTSGWALVMIFEYAVIAPLAEETLKPLGSLLRRPASRAEALLFGVGAGTGFAIAENLLYATGWMVWWDGWLPISLMRMPGAALHAFGAGLVSLGIFEARHRVGPRRCLARRYATAFGAHALWNGTIAVTIILFSERALSGTGFSGTAFAWGAGLAAVLAGLGAVVLAGLLMVARGVAAGTVADPLTLTSLDRPAGVAAWSMAGMMVTIPVAILLSAFPGFVAL